MTFRRTSYGLRNQPAFFDSDLVVYVEGADLSDEDGRVEEFSGRALTQDALFWKGVLGLILPGKRFHFKALGSKSALAEFSAGLDDTVRGSLLICFDNDLDGVIPRTVAMNFAVPTYRYSWEGDIWVWVVFVRVLESLLPSDGVSDELLRNARSARDRFFRSIFKFGKLDVQTATESGLEYFLPRDNPAAVTVAKRRGFPEVNSPFLKSRLALYRSRLRRPWRPGLSSAYSRKRHLFGKAIDRFHCQLLVACIREVGLPSSVPFFVFQNAAIRSLPEVLDQPVRTRQLQHYKAAVLAAL